MSFGLRLKASITRRRHILEVVEELKHRFRKLLYMYQDKKSQQAFLELKSMIENYDNKGASKDKPQLGGKFSKQALRAKIPESSLLTVEEREEEYDVTTYRASNDSILKRNHP